jgi:cobalt-zinc-cadmium efflux system membrane fusion protein
LAAASVLPACGKDAPVAPPAAAAALAAPAEDLVVSAQAIAAAGVVVATARPGRVGHVVFTAGEIDFAPESVARVGTPVLARVIDVHAKVGDSVAVGDVLCKLEGSDVAAARADLATAKVRLVRADLHLHQERSLTLQGSSSPRAVADAQAEHDVIAAELAAARQKLAAWDADATASGPSFTLRSPVAARVLAANPRQGQTVTPGEPLFVLGQNDVVWLLAEVYERDLRHVRLGLPAKVEVLAVAGTWDARVEHIAEVVDPLRRAVVVRLSLANPNGALRPGMSARARIFAAPDLADAATPTTAAETLSVPRGAVQTLDGLPILFVEKSPGKFQVRPVALGNQSDEEVEITRNLQPGERIVIEGAFLLKGEYLREQMGKND